jgi:hypothetical protein
MRGMRSILLGLVTAALLVGCALVADAEAEIRFNASLHAPGVSVQIGNAPPGYRVYGSGYLPVRRLSAYRIARMDRQIARRLAWYTGVSSRKLIRLRAKGYDWFEIGHWLRLPQPVVRAAFAKRSWDRFIHGRQRLAGTPRRGRHRVACYVD